MAAHELLEAPEAFVWALLPAFEHDGAVALDRLAEERRDSGHANMTARPNRSQVWHCRTPRG
jgi:hypothetical protein